MQSEMDRLMQKGWLRRDNTLTRRQAFIQGALIALPFAVFAG